MKWRIMYYLMAIASFVIASGAGWKWN